MATNWLENGHELDSVPEEVQFDLDRLERNEFRSTGIPGPRRPKSAATTRMPSASGRSTSTSLTLVGLLFYDLASLPQLGCWQADSSSDIFRIGY